jgi:hypothetical protein
VIGEALVFASFGSAFDLLPLVISATVVFFALDLWRRMVEAARLLGGQGRPLAPGVALAVWKGLALLATHIPALGSAVASTPGVQPALLLGTILAAALAGWPSACRRAFDRIPVESILAFFYWRAVFGALLIASYAAGRLPAGFAIPAGLGDMAVTMLMVLVLALWPASARIPRGPILLWNAIGLIDLLIVPLLGAVVLRPWAAQRGLSGHFGLQLFAVPLFIGIHLHIFGRLWCEKRDELGPS